VGREVSDGTIYGLLHPLGVRPGYDVGRVGWGSGLVPVDSAPPEGVRIIHVIPSGIACVRDEVSRAAPVNGRFEAYLSAVYGNEAVAQSLAAANGLVPNENGDVSVYVPAGLPIIIPAMCYAKEGASAVTLQPSGTPEGDSGGSSNSAAWIVIIAVVILLIVGIKKLAS
jgi:hypothetical protein